jgi:hypothetical protein
MSNNYLKVGKLYNLSSNTYISINGASFIHGINNNHDNAIIVTIDGYEIHVAKDTSVSFSIPIAFSQIKIGNSSTAVIVYS